MSFRFFLGREVPRESLVFMVRALGGEASWDETCAPGATFKEGDSQVTHQVGMHGNEVGRSHNFLWSPSF